MNEQRLMEALVSSVGQVRSGAEIIAVKQLSLDDMQVRMRRFLAQLGQRESRSLDRGDWHSDEQQTVIRLPQGARAMLYHASGTMKYISGRPPFEALFDHVASREELTRIVTGVAGRCQLEQWAGERGDIVFERLWQTKAQGVDTTGKASEPVLTRIVGAYRHVIDGMPVLGAASVALELAGNQAIDAMTVQVRPVTSDTVDKARIVSPEAGALQIVLQLGALLGQGCDRLEEDAIDEARMQFGYLDLGKRKSQRLLAPAFVAQISIRHKLERQAYVLTAAATEKPYLSLCQCGDEVTMAGRQGRTRA